MARKVLSGKDNVNGFQKNPQNINRKGRPRKMIADVIAELEKQGIKAATKSDILDIYMRLINMEIPELEQIVKDPTQPALVRIVGKSILSGKGFDTIEKMLDRSIGKAEQKTDITTGGVALNIDPFAKIR
ncbi:MAG TPA: hypothetical protein PLS84_11900, partial [Salinivirgaceae bacterium]|nr:hypothetical protein [Salinivirgaceae bacterium]